MLFGSAPAADPPNEVATVTVRAARLPPAAGDPTFSILRLSADQIQTQPRLDQVLAEAPGASLFRRTDSLGANPTTQGVSLRAIGPSGASRALVTLDGVPLNDPFGGWMIWSALAPESISRAEIIRGAGAGPYGAGALTGTIALEERDDPAGAGLADASAGGLGDRRGAALGTVALGSGALFAVASGEVSNGWIPVRRGGGSVDTPLRLDSREAAARYSADVGRGVIAARLSAYAEDRGTGVRGGVADASGAAESLTWAAPPEPGRAGFRLQLWGRQSRFSQTSLSIAPGRASATPANDQFATPADGVGMNGAWRKAGRASSVEVGFDLRTAEGQDHELFRYLAGRFTRERLAGGRSGVAGIYVESSRRAGPWLLTSGARIDYWRDWGGMRLETDRASGAVTFRDAPRDQQGVTPNGRLGLRREFGDGWYSRTAAYSGFRPATLNELHRPFRVGNDVTESNPLLKPERLYGAEAGGGYAQGSLTFDADVFLNRLVDPVTNVTIGVGPATYPRAGFIPVGGTLRVRENVGAIEALGFEAEARKVVAHHLEFRTGVSVTDARVHGGAVAAQLTGKRPAEAPVWTGTAGVTWRASARLSLAADARLESNRFEDDQNLRRLGPGATLNARVDWRLTTSAALFLRADNLFNGESATGAAADGTLSYTAPRVISAGITLRR